VIRFVDTIDAASRPTPSPPPRPQPRATRSPAYELFIGDAGVWDTDSGTVIGQNGPSVYTGWKGLRFIGFNNSNGAWNQISAEDLQIISTKVTAAVSAGQNPFLMGHHPHDDEGVIPLAGVLENPSVHCYAHGHSGARALSLSTASRTRTLEDEHQLIFDTGDPLHEVFATKLVYVLELYTNPTSPPRRSDPARLLPSRWC
jgi:hypothetical protein